MKLIDEIIIQELIDISKEWNSDEATTEERNLKIDLLVNQAEQLQLNFQNPLENLPPHVTSVFEALLSRHKYKAIIGLNELKKASTKRQYNANARYLIQRKLYFPSLYRSIKRNIAAYAHMNKMIHVKEFQIFILEDKEGAINE